MSDLREKIIEIVRDEIKIDTRGDTRINLTKTADRIMELINARGPIMQKIPTDKILEELEYWGVDRAHRGSAYAVIRDEMIEEQKGEESSTGIFHTLTTEQRAAALSYDGPVASGESDGPTRTPR